MRSSFRISLLVAVFCGLMFCQQQQNPPGDPEPVAVPVQDTDQPPRVVIYPTQPGQKFLVRRLNKRCSGNATFVAGSLADVVPTLKADYLLDYTSMWTFSATLSNGAGDKLTTFHAKALQSSFISQICSYFDGLKAAASAKAPVSEDQAVPASGGKK